MHRKSIAEELEKQRGLQLGLSFVASSLRCAEQARQSELERTDDVKRYLSLKPELTESLDFKRVPTRRKAAMNKNRTSKSIMSGGIAGGSAAIIYLIVLIITGGTVAGANVVTAALIGLITGVVVFALAYVVSISIARTRAASR